MASCDLLDSFISLSLLPGVVWDSFSSLVISGSTSQHRSKVYLTPLHVSLVLKGPSDGAGSCCSALAVPDVRCTAGSTSDSGRSAVANSQGNVSHSEARNSEDEGVSNSLSCDCGGFSQVPLFPSRNYWSSTSTLSANSVSWCSEWSNPHSKTTCNPKCSLT